jgi:hypothetical protein
VLAHFLCAMLHGMDAIRAYAHKHMLCSSVTKSLRDAASVCIASDALQQSQHQNMPAAGSVA